MDIPCDPWLRFSAADCGVAGDRQAAPSREPEGNLQGGNLDAMSSEALQLPGFFCLPLLLLCRPTADCKLQGTMPLLADSPDSAMLTAPPDILTQCRSVGVTS